MGIIHGFKNRFGGYSYPQRLVRDVTADNDNDPEPYAMRQIANMTHNSKNLEPIMEILYQRMNDKGKHWVHMYKALNLLRYLLSYGGSEVVESYKKNTYFVQSLCTYKQLDDEGRDIADGIRQSAKEIIALAEDKPRLEASREEAAKKLKVENERDQEAIRRQQAVMMTTIAATTAASAASTSASCGGC